MEIPSNLLSLFTAEIEERRGEYVIEVPEDEISLGEIKRGGTYRVVLLSTPAQGEEPEPIDRGSEPADRAPEHHPGQDMLEPPVEEGETRTVRIEDVGDQGDGIARVDRGYIVFVPGTEIGDIVSIEVTDVRENFAFAEPVDETASEEPS